MIRANTFLSSIAMVWNVSMSTVLFFGMWLYLIGFQQKKKVAIKCARERLSTVSFWLQQTAQLDHVSVSIHTYCKLIESTITYNGISYFPMFSFSRGVPSGVQHYTLPKRHVYIFSYALPVQIWVLDWIRCPFQGHYSSCFMVTSLYENNWLQSVDQMARGNCRRTIATMMKKTKKKM